MSLEELRARVEARLDELSKKFRSALNAVNEELRRLSEEVAKGAAVSQERVAGIRERLRELRGELLESRLELKSLLREARLASPGGGGEELDELRERIEASLEAWSDVLEDLLDDLRELYRELVRRRPRMTVAGLPVQLPDIGEVVDRSVRAALEGVEAGLKKLEEAFRGGVEGPSIVISSIRLPRRDAQVIDALVEAGVFRSRSEAVSFFTRRGIESARHMLDELLEKLEELREMREKLRREVRESLGEEG